MELISSDTNIWIDFEVIGYIETPFLLKEKYKYLISQDALNDEILSPPDLGNRLRALGLEPTDINNEEYKAALKYGREYNRLSVYDCIALSIAKLRHIKLLSGDGALRYAAECEGVEVHGTLWILDELWDNMLIDKNNYIFILQKIKENCGKNIRLPVSEIEKRLEMLRR